MKILKEHKFIYLIIAIVFVVYNICLFAIAGFAGHTATFWSSYIFVIIGAASFTFIMTVLFTKGTDIKDWIFKFPVIKHSVIYICTELIISIVFMIFEKKIPAGWAVAAQFVILAFFAVMAISCFIAKETIENIDTEVKEKTAFVKLLRVDTDMLAERCGDADLKEKLDKLAENVRYSDPVSNDALKEIEGDIAEKVSECKKAVEAEDYTTASTLCDEALLLLSERNKKCKILK